MAQDGRGFRLRGLLLDDLWSLRRRGVWTAHYKPVEQVRGDPYLYIFIHSVSRVVLRKVQPRAAAAPEPVGPSHLEELLALRAARNLAAAADPPADPPVGAESANSSSTPVVVPAGAPAS
jgi:hypothetical protein